MPPTLIRLDAVISAAHQSVFACLLQVNEEHHLHAVLRVAGGWVRDTLLGLHSNDIDIAIETPSPSTSSPMISVEGLGVTALTPVTAVTGEQFARAVSAFQTTHGSQGRTVSVIRVNPALSKHIETATVCVCDLPVEFCALRTDDYCDDSRIPQVRPATPLEDALRRDFTINALFYNLHTGMVEDYTTGLSDLQDRLLRCPLDPKRTFMDDPLRLLRGVRFVGQLGALDFRLDSAILSSVDQQLLTVLQQKVSRERVGKEVFKMLSVDHPEKCVSILHDMKVLQTVLLVEVYMKQIPGKKQCSAEVDRTARLVDHDADGEGRLRQTMRLNQTAVPCVCGTEAILSTSPEQQVDVVLFLLLLPFFRKASTEEVSDRVYAVCINGLKLPVSSHHSIRRMMDAYNELLLQHLSPAELSTMDKVASSTQMKLFDALGHLNDHHVIPEALKVVLLAYWLLEIRADILETADVAAAYGAISALWVSLLNHCPSLLGAHSMALPIKGNELKGLLGIPAKDIGKTLTLMRRRMVLCPTTSREEMLDWLRNDPAL